MGLRRRTQPIAFSDGLEFMFWISFMMPGIATTIAWISLLDPDLGLIILGLEKLPFINEDPFNIFSIPGTIWANIMGNGIIVKVMLLTPAFRNMDASMKEAARVSGTGWLRTYFRV